MKEILENIILDSAKVAGEKLMSAVSDSKDSKIIKDDGANAKELSGNKNGKQMSSFVYSAVIGLALCLAVLTVYKKEMPEDVREVVSTITNVFGECLKEVYNSEFGLSKKIPKI